MNKSIRVIDDLLEPDDAINFCYMVMTHPMYCPCDHAVDRSEADGSIREMGQVLYPCLLYTSPSPRDSDTSRMPSSA